MNKISLKPTAVILLLLFLQPMSAIAEELVGRQMIYVMLVEGLRQSIFGSRKEIPQAQGKEVAGDGGQDADAAVCLISPGARKNHHGPHVPVCERGIAMSNCEQCQPRSHANPDIHP